MKNIWKHSILIMLVLSLLLCGTVSALAVEDEEYLSDLRIIYAEDYSEAQNILSDLDMEDYKLLKENLNAGTGKIGVWLAYKTTTDIEDAITDIAIMQMKGGYSEGNYREMLKQSYDEYLAMGENYQIAIEYFANAYEAGHYLSEMAYRQLNLYTVVTEGIDDIPAFEGELLGDIFCDGIDAADLATMFMEGNSYALANIRSLIAMGVSYNEDGNTYLDKVGMEAAALMADPDVYANEDLEELAALIAPTIISFQSMFKELEAHEAELNYEDEEITDDELKYLEYKAMAEMMRKTSYLDGKTLYEFCMSYVTDTTDHSALYPLAAALNEGQVAMVKVAHFYDVVRYSMVIEQNEDIDAELAALEEQYSEKPFNVYTGVDRTVYRDSFALTSAASRADAFTESGLAAALYGDDYYHVNTAATAVGGVGACIMAVGAGIHMYKYFSMKSALKAYKTRLNAMKNTFGYRNVYTVNGIEVNPSLQIDLCFPDDVPIADNVYNSMTFQEKFDYLDGYLDSFDHPDEYQNFMEIKRAYEEFASEHDDWMASYRNKGVVATEKYSACLNAVYTLYIVGGVMTLISAITLGISVYNYYHPTYDDIPTAMVDLIDTTDGDRYIKYDVVYEAEPKSDGSYAAADLNAFQAQRWNAMYYTKSYEAGKPLLADEFVISTTSNVPANDYMPVHRFGEVVSYNLNKYNFNETQSIYLSVKQSEHQKSAVADVPELIGSVIGTGYYFLAGGIGLILGAGCTIGTQAILKKKKTKATTEA